MARKDQLTFWENDMKKWVREAEKKGRGQRKIQDVVRNQFLQDLRDAVYDAYDEVMNEMDLVPSDSLDAMLWQYELSGSIVVDHGKLWVKPGGVLILYEEGAIPSPGAYPESEVAYEIQDRVSAYLAKNYSSRVYIEDINNAVGMVAVDSDTLGIKEVMT